MSFILQPCFQKQKVIILLHRLLLLFHYIGSSQSSGRHVAVQLPAKGVTKVKGIDYNTCGTDQKQEGSEPPGRCCGLPILASDKEEIPGVISFVCLAVCLHTLFTDVCTFNLSLEETEPSEEPLQTTRSRKPQTKKPQNGIRIQNCASMNYPWLLALKSENNKEAIPQSLKN